ncbi:MAG: trigger factor [Candidatus Marinimicrobia bacterium]|nr:trigger factor [Candidatus Neomarinimicrobiota bacterium]
MNIDVKIISPVERELHIERSWTEMESDYAVFTRKFAKDIALPGFRKGKVPLSLIEKRYGPQIDLDFINEKFSDYYGEALKEKKLLPVNEPEILDWNFKKGDPLKISVKFEVMPDWDLPKYKDHISLENHQHQIDDADVEEYLQRLRENAAEVTPVESGAKEGQHLIANIQEIHGETEIINESEDTRIILGKAPFEGEALKQLLGVKAGETRDIRMKSPDKDHDHEHLYRIAVTAVEEHVLPELNDEFAKTVNPDTESLDALKATIRKELEDYWNGQAAHKIEEDIADHFIDKMKDLSLPRSVVNEHANVIYEDIRKRYPSAPELDKTAVLEQYGDTAEKSLKWQLVKNRIVRDEKLEVSDEDINARIDEMLKDVNAELRDTYGKYYQSPQVRNQLQDDIVNRKIFEHIKSHAKIKNKKITRMMRIKEPGK